MNSLNFTPHKKKPETLIDIRRDSGFRLGLIHRQGRNADEGNYSFTLGVPVLRPDYLLPMSNGEAYVSDEEVAEIEAMVEALNRQLSETETNNQQLNQ